MTTNHIDRLDPALIRPGRCDVRIEVRNASKAQMAKMFARFFPDATETAAAQFAARLPSDELSMAQIQGHLLEHRGDATKCIRNVPKLLTCARLLLLPGSRAS